MGEKFSGEQFQKQESQKSKQEIEQELQEKSKTTVINLLERSKADWENKDPEEIIMEADRYIEQCKQILYAASIAENDNLLSSNLLEKLKELSHKYYQKEYQPNLEDIEEMNQFIDEILSYLEKH